MDTSILSIEHIVKRFGKFYALNDVSFEIPQGSTFGIIGPNGAGKSTLLRIATALAHPTSGRILVNGIDVQESPGRALQGTAAIIDTPAFYLDLTAKNNLDIMSRGRGDAYKKRRDELIEYTGLSAWMDKKVRTFSLGMKQRLSIALAMLPDSKFVILDEPTNGLDPSGIVDIRNLIQNLAKDFQMTILVTSHILSEIEKICSHIAILNHGKLAASGSIADLLNRKPVTKIGCSDPQRAEKLLHEAQNLDIHNITIEPNGCLAIATGVPCAAQLNKALVDAGIDVFMITAEPNHLEKIFLELTQKHN